MYRNLDIIQLFQFKVLFYEKSDSQLKLEGKQ